MFFALIQANLLVDQVDYLVRVFYYESYQDIQMFPNDDIKTHRYKKKKKKSIDHINLLE